jgi:mRNA-degrading endonuclease YafQ of YafQ-DinJ toxin-antitoxin module
MRKILTTKTFDKVFSCRVNFSIRIVFKYDHEYIYLESIGTHDEVY